MEPIMKSIMILSDINSMIPIIMGQKDIKVDTNLVTFSVSFKTSLTSSMSLTSVNFLLILNVFRLHISAILETTS